MLCMDLTARRRYASTTSTYSSWSLVNIEVLENTVYEVLFVETDATAPTATLVVGVLMRNRKTILDGFFCH